MDFDSFKNSERFMTHFVQHVKFKCIYKFLLLYIDFQWLE